MVIEDVTNNILEYLKKQGQTNTFRLASELDIDRYRILNIIKKLEEKRAVEVKSGIVRFLKFPREEKKVIKKKPIEVKKAHSKPKKKVKHKKTALEITQAENKRLKEKLLELETIKERQASIKNKKIREQTEQIESMGKTIKELQKVPPKVIRRTKVKKIPVKVREYITKIKKVPIKSRKLKEQAELIKKLEEEIGELKQKASAPPKVIRRTVVKKVPVKVKEYITKTIIKKVPIKVKEETPKKEKIKPKKFKFPKINLSGLGKNIKKLNVPEILKKS